MLCRAKVNLTLHVGAAIESGKFKGYHPLESLVVFADVGDRLMFEPSEGNGSMSFTGPFADMLFDLEDNSIWQALRLCDAPPHHVSVEKNLPVAAGLGGGTADAAGVLREFDPEGRFYGLEIGADGPVCRLSKTAMMEGIGERLTPMPGLGRVPALLVNPGVQVSTGSIFKALDAEARPEQPARTSRSGTLLERALSGTNDMQAAAVAAQPVIAEVISTIAAQDGCQLSRMSGSGATCFGLFYTMEQARAAAERIERDGWWVVPTWLGDTDECP